MKVLLFSNDLMPFGNLPTSGGGLRCWQLKKGLESRGIEVVSSMPGFTYLATKHAADIPEEQKADLWEFATQDDIYRRVKPDAVLFASNWDHFNLTGNIDVPIIIDLHGSRLIETAMWNSPIDPEKKVSTLNRADCILSAGQRQRLYFYGWLLQAGRVPEDEHFIRYIPISLSPNLPDRVYPGGNDELAPRIVSGGGWFPWQNQAKAVFALCRAIEQRNAGSISIFGGPHERQGGSAEEEMIFRLFAEVKGLAENSERISVTDYIGRNQLIDIYRRSSLAVECMEYNLERELAFTTRTIEYLWCGLPVLYNNYSEISDHILEYDAGWTFDPSDEKAISNVIDEIFANPESIGTKGENARQLVRDRFTWDKTIQPLVDFLENPSKAVKAEPVLGTVHARPAFLNLRGETVNTPLGGNRLELEQRFVVPAENICGVEIPLSLSHADAASEVERITCSVSKPSGKVVARRVIPVEKLPASGRLLLPFSFMKQPAGGEELIAKVRVEPTTPDARRDSVTVKSYLHATYPFVVNGSETLALSFLPSDSYGIYRYRVYFGRALNMIRSGQYKRLFRAVNKRAAAAIHRLLPG